MATMQTARLNSKPGLVNIAFPTALAFASLVMLLWGLQAMVSVHADPGPVYVDGVTGNDDLACGGIGTPCKTIAWAHSVRAVDGDSVLIAAGTYTENLLLNGGISLTLRGGYVISGTAWLLDAGETVIDGSGTLSQSVVSVNNGSAVILDKLTITGGRAPGAGGVFAGNATVTILRCTIRDNILVGGDGGAGVTAVNGPMTIVDSVVIRNRVDHPGGPGGTGGAGGVRAGPPSPLTMVNTLVADNLGDAGIHANNSLTLTNVTVANNDGDIIFNPATTATLDIANTVVYSQFTFLANCPPGSVCQVRYSDVEGWMGGGTGNINVNPLYIGAGNYRLQAGSPCIDRGTPAGAPVADIEGHARDAAPDMGAYEWQGTRIYVPLALKSYAGG
jgi:hypothetical protein